MIRSLILICIVVSMAACSLPKVEKKNFAQYRSEQFGEKSGKWDESKKRHFVYSSEQFHIDTIYRSMFGPLQKELVTLSDSSDIVWLTDYKVEVFDTNNNPMSIEFVCHNNLNLPQYITFPWNEGVWKYNRRVFTLTQGITDVSLPGGYGIPLPGYQPIEVVFQALNHNLAELDTHLVHKITLSYFLESEIDFPIKALKHRNIWLFKQYGGPEGQYGTPTEEGHVLKETEISVVQQPSCGIDMLANNEAISNDLFWDNYGRKYTGHWKVPPGEEYLEFDVTRLMFLQGDEKVFYMNAHLHPFCEYLQLFDQTDSTVLYTARVNSYENKKGIISISDTVYPSGLDIFKDHRYVLRSKYNNQSEDTLSAMSVIYLYSGF